MTDETRTGSQPNETTTPEEAAEFFLAIGGTWVTDCGCRTVTDLEQHDVEDYVHEKAAGRYAVTYVEDYGDGVTGPVVYHQGPSAHDAIETALHHDCEPGARINR